MSVRIVMWFGSGHRYSYCGLGVKCVVFWTVVCNCARGRDDEILGRRGMIELDLESKASGGGRRRGSA
jgi:hypothetical protein